MKITFEEPATCEVYEIAEENGMKYIHILAYFAKWFEIAEWKHVDGTWMIVPLNEFVENYKNCGRQEYVHSLWEETKQYESDLDADTVVRRLNDYQADAVLPYTDITPETPCGTYVTCL